MKAIYASAVALLAITSPAPSLLANPLVYEEGGVGIGDGKHIVFIASDHEYRSEETCPAIARILAKHHGFKTTVLFGLDDQGHITAGASNVPGMDVLEKADGLVIFTRFLNLPDAQMKHLVAYLDRGGPVVGLRTASHAFKIPKGSTYYKYDFRYPGAEFKNGFGEQILGNTWVGHYGKNHQQGTRIQIIPEQKDHVILTGVKDGAFTHAGGYNGIPGPDFTVLTNSQPLVSMEKDAKADPKKPPVASTWTRHYQSKIGKEARVFHSTQGASEDILDADYRRMLVNGILWSIGLESKISADLKIDFVGPYKPNTFRGGGCVRNVKPADLAGYDSPIMPDAEENRPAGRAKKKQPAKKAPKKKTKNNNKQDAKNRPTNKPVPEQDPELAKYYINLKTSPRPQQAKPVQTELPLDIPTGSRIAFVGNLLLDNERRFGHLESLIHQRFPDRKITVRNLAWPADEIDLQPRPDNFGDLDQHLHYFGADIIIAAFGANESFAGEAGLAAFEVRLDKFLKHIAGQAYNGRTAARVVLLSPTANEDIASVSAGTRNNGSLKAYTAKMRAVADRHPVAFVDVFTPTATAFALLGTDCTADGHALNAVGHSEFAVAAFKEMFGSDAPEIDEAVRARVVEKATQFFYRYRPLNTFYYTGGRNKNYGYLDFLPAMRNFDLMVANRDKAIHAAAAGNPGEVDDSNIPKMDDVKMSRGANEWLSPADELKAFKVDPRFEVNCFASEEDFPELACPIQMRWDARGRLWVSCSTTYPHVYPGQGPADKIVILEDTDQDGKADTCKTFADDLHIPLSFVLDGRGGVYVSEEPHLSYVADTDGDDRADHREIIFTGFGCEDSHHALHDFVWTPGGDLLFRESIFHNSQVETAYGPVRAKNSSWFLYHPSSRKLTAFGCYRNTNPWGVTFDPWGNHVASHPVFASTFHATNRGYPEQHLNARGMQAYSGVCGQDFVDFDFWPEEMQGGYLKVRYKPTNRVEFHHWIEREDCFEEKYVSDVIFSTNLSFIPVDFRFGPRGAAYVCDWYNPIKGHAQYSLRDPRRDRRAGRIWRIVPKGAALAKAPEIDGAPVAELVELLKSPHYRYRYWAKRELRTREKGEVLAQLKRFLAAGASDLHRLEALWLMQAFDAPDPNLLASLTRSSDHLVAASAFGPLRFWHSQLGSDKTAQLLRAGAAHTSQHVRREAILAASYVGTGAALEAVLPVLEQEAGTHLSYAIHTALSSENLARHWRGSKHERQITAVLAQLAKGAQTKPVVGNANDADFDSQKGLQTVEIGCVPERMLFTETELKVKAGKPVKLIFKNPDATQHNIVILDRNGDVEKVGMAGNEMAKDPDGIKKHFVPDDKSILHHSKLLDPNTVETLRFIAPKKPGKYPYVCTFPGHWVLMRGVMIVEK